MENWQWYYHRQSKTSKTWIISLIWIYPYIDNGFNQFKTMDISWYIMIYPSWNSPERYCIGLYKNGEGLGVQTLMTNFLSSRPHQIWSCYRVEILRYPLFLRQEETSATHSIVVCVPLYPITSYRLQPMMMVLYPFISHITPFWLDKNPMVILLV